MLVSKPRPSSGKRDRSGVVAKSPQCGHNAIAEQIPLGWDLLRQRRALGEFSENVDAAKACDVEVVERYKG